VVHARLAQALLLSDDMAGAEQELIQARQIEPAEPSVRYNLGRLYELLGRDADALQEYLAFLKNAPEDPRANNIRSRVALYYENEGDQDSALRFYRDLLARDPSRAGSHFAVANILYRRARYEEALPKYREVLRLDPSNASAHANIGFILRIKGRLKEAVEEYTNAVELNPTDVSSLFFLGTLKADLSDDAGAMASFQQVVQREPQHPLVHYAIGKIHARRGERGAAQREFDLHRAIQAEERKKQRTASTMKDD
ncbi:MAG: tetratricopeptide repeat protein, partial [bacterium]